MIDEEGNYILDCINNVACVGHCHPDVVKAGKEANIEITRPYARWHQLLFCQIPQLKSIEYTTLCRVTASGSNYSKKDFPTPIDRINDVMSYRWEEFASGAV